jgi:hypothetical protein
MASVTAMLLMVLMMMMWGRPVSSAAVVRHVLAGYLRIDAAVEIERLSGEMAWSDAESQTEVVAKV